MNSSGGLFLNQRKDIQCLINSVFITQDIKVLHAFDK